MTEVKSPERSRAYDGETIDFYPEDDDRARWNITARIDLFDIESVEACRAALGLDHEPVSHELQRWARDTRGSARGDHEPIIVDGNLLTRLGLARLGNLFLGATGAASQALNATHCRIGVGVSATAAATTDTDLGAASGSGNRQFKLVDSVAQGTGANSGVSTIVATFGTGVANFAWAEWGIDGGTGDGTTVTSESASTPGLCNHKIASLLTKTSSVVAVFTITITIA